MRVLPSTVTATGSDTAATKLSQKLLYLRGYRIPWLIYPDIFIKTQIPGGKSPTNFGQTTIDDGMRYGLGEKSEIATFITASDIKWLHLLIAPADNLQGCAESRARQASTYGSALMSVNMQHGCSWVPGKDLNHLPHPLTCYACPTKSYHRHCITFKIYTVRLVFTRHRAAGKVAIISVAPACLGRSGLRSDLMEHPSGVCQNYGTPIRQWTRAAHWHRVHWQSAADPETQGKLPRYSRSHL